MGLSHARARRARSRGTTREVNQMTETPQAPHFEERITPDRFARKTVIVTGAGSGIGLATALRIAREGGRVIAADVSADRLQALKDGHADLDLVTVQGDVSDETSVQAVVAAAGERIDGLANVAGIMDEFHPVHEVPDAIWERVMRINVDGVMRMTRAVIPPMLAAGRGSIVNVASEAGLRGSAAGAAYTTSKHAVVGLTRSCSVMYALQGIRTNAVVPGGVKTNIVATMSSAMGVARTGALMQANMPPVADAAELAAAITYLLSDDASNISGAILPSDGGWSAI